ncbi:MAG: heme anaerobic degradation radical SAM methyltransferase ChuW/HutW [Hyphomicrobiales bacterium]|nr:heme anaerobic degradation radical SAM methyltransferase ChuW/HutW [Hyphomicrobiales bacterium]
MRGMSVEAFMADVSDVPLTSAFKRRAPVIPWRGAVPVADQEIAFATSDLLSRPRTGRTVAYVHIPFCHNHCLFCGFYQNAWSQERSEHFVDRLIDEIRQASAHRLFREGPTIEAIYLGGGTPTALRASDLKRLLLALRTELPLARDCEITLEGRVFDFGHDKAETAIDAGINRISLGVQSFDTQVRRRLGRKTATDTLLKEVADLTAHDDVAIVIDLMYGLPGQDDRVWLRDLEYATSIELDGLDIYALNVWPNGPLAQAVASGKALPLPTLADQAKAYGRAGELLAGEGWRKISHAHFARTRLERNIYNRSVKAGATCLAFGPGAGGYAHGYRWRNVPVLARWEELVASGQPTFDGLSQVSRNHAAQTVVVAGLEAGVLDCAQVEAEAPGFLASAAPLMRNWCRAGLADFRSDILSLTHAGWFWMTTMTAGLHAAIEAIGREQEACG